MKGEKFKPINIDLGTEKLGEREKIFASSWPHNLKTLGINNRQN